MSRPKEQIRIEITRTKERLDAYYAREAEMLSPDGVQMYTIGSRSLQRYQTSLAAIQEEIHRLESKLAELEAELAGKTRRLAVGVIPRDW